MEGLYWIVPGLLAGRPGPGQVLWDLEEMWADGFRTIVSLSRIGKAAIRAAGFRHHYAPLNGGLAFAPPWKQLMARKILSVTDFIAAELEMGRPTLVHCRAGKDRTGAVLASFLVCYRGLSASEAIGQVRQANPRAMTAPGFARLPELVERLKRAN